MNAKWQRWDSTYFKAGTTLTAAVPYMSYEPRKIHIDHVFDSIYKGRQLIICRVYGKHNQWWHEFMCTNSELAQYVDKAKDFVKQ